MFMLQFGSIAILARLLAPEAFGLIAMVTAVTNLGALFCDMGLSLATIQREEITEPQVSNLFWLNTLIGSVVALLVAVSSPLLVVFYGEQTLYGITLVLSVSFVVAAMSIQHQALLRRHMLLGRLACVDVVSQFLSISVGVFFAISMKTYWALVFMQLAQVLFRCCGLFIACPWRPMLFQRGVGTKDMFHFGLNVAGFNVLNYFTRNLDKMLIGRFVGAGTLGFYSRAYQLALFPIHKINGPVSAAVQPALSRLQDDPEAFRQYYRQALGVISAVGTPIVVYVFLMADEIILLLLGEGWGESALYLRWLMPAALCAVTNVATGWVYNSLGHVHRQFRWGVYASVFLCGAMLIGVQWGGVGVVVAISISRVIQKIPGLLYCYRDTFLCLSDFASPVMPAIYSSLVAVGVVCLFGGVSALPKYEIVDTHILIIESFLVC